MQVVKHPRRGAVDPISLIVISVVLFGGATIAGWKPFKFLQKKPPTEEVTKLQEQLAKAQAEAAAARLVKEAAEAAERARKDDQIRWSQQMGAGAAEAIKRVPAEHRTSEVQLASDLIARSNLGLALAIGDLPKEKQIEILAIVDKALSSVQAERDDARAQLKQKDIELKLVTEDRETIRKEIPKLQHNLETKEAEKAAIQGDLTKTTNRLNVWATKADVELRKNASLGGAFDNWVRGVAIVAGIWAFLAFVLPGIIKHMESSPLKNRLRDLSGYALNPLLHHDAKSKLTELQATPPSP